MATNPPVGMEYLDDSDDSSYPRWKNSPDTSQLATGLDYSFNPDLSKHVSIIEDAKYISDNLTNIGTAVVEPMALASQFISKGSSSLFRFCCLILLHQMWRLPRFRNNKHSRFITIRIY